MEEYEVTKLTEKIASKFSPAGRGPILVVMIILCLSSCQAFLRGQMNNILRSRLASETTRCYNYRQIAVHSVLSIGSSPRPSWNPHRMTAVNGKNEDNPAPAAHQWVTGCLSGGRCSTRFDPKALPHRFRHGRP